MTRSTTTRTQRGARATLGVIASALALAGLAGCGSADDATTSPDAEVTTTVEPAPSSEPVSTTEAPRAPETTVADTTAPAPEPDAGSDLDGYEEAETVRANVDQIDDLDVVVETNNPGTRVILYRDDTGRPRYKSVYVKNDKRLKVIDLGSDGLLFDEVIGRPGLTPGRARPWPD